jgi:hypothetical protein
VTDGGKGILTYEKVCEYLVTVYEESVRHVRLCALSVFNSVSEQDSSQKILYRSRENIQ